MTQDKLITVDPEPMPLPQFMRELGKLARARKWKTYQEAVKKRSDWFESRGMMDKF